VSGHYYDVHDRVKISVLICFSGECAAPNKHEVISWKIQIYNFIIFNFHKTFFNDDIMRRVVESGRNT
jgi:hypothetical protein